MPASVGLPSHAVSEPYPIGHCGPHVVLTVAAGEGCDPQCPAERTVHLGFSKGRQRLAGQWVPCQGDSSLQVRSLSQVTRRFGFSEAIFKAARQEVFGAGLRFGLRFVPSCSSFAWVGTQVCGEDHCPLTAGSTGHCEGLADMSERCPDLITVRQHPEQPEGVH